MTLSILYIGIYGAIVYSGHAELFNSLPASQVFGLWGLGFELGSSGFWGFAVITTRASQHTKHHPSKSAHFALDALDSDETEGMEKNAKYYNGLHRDC